MRVRRGTDPAAAISLVSMIDVLMIMLVFFMVTSTFLDLDMLPLAAPEAEAAGAANADAGPPGEAPRIVLVRIGGDGGLRLGGRRVPPDALVPALADALSERPGAAVSILASGHARTSDLVLVMDAALAAGAPTIRLLRLEAGG